MSRLFPLAVLVTALAAAAAAQQPMQRPQLILPQNRSALYSGESLELAVAGLPAGKSAVVELRPKAAHLSPLRLTVAGDGSTVTVALPAYALAPDRYDLRLDGNAAGELTIASGVPGSTMLLSQTISEPEKGGANFLVGNAASFGLLTPEGLPAREIRGRRSRGLQQFDDAVARNLPTLLYQYWTGYTFHKPWGPEKSWAAPDMMTQMRQMTLHVAQRLRTRARNIHAIGTIDEPGLGWGKTPAGHTATGFPDWDEKAYYERHGWRYTDDPASRPDADWLKYLTVRCGVIRANQAQAKADWHSLLPGVPFSTDLYAPHAIMDGTDPLAQEVNDIPATHVFTDFNYGKVGTLGGLYLEKAHNPLAKVAHAMNGQLLGKPVPQPQQRYTYHLMLNALLAGGLHSNWWLNTGNMSTADLTAVNEPGQRYGPLFQQMNLGGHDVALLWSFTELGMREKAPTARAAKEQSAQADAYNVGLNYMNSVLGAHQAMSRAGYPAHILHERLLPRGVLKDYKTLVIIGQTFPLPPDVRRAIAEFQKGGGKLITDRSSTAELPGALVTGADFKDLGQRMEAAKPPAGASSREASLFETNYFKDQWARAGSPLIRETLRKTKARPVLKTDSVFLVGERHQGGEGALYLVINAHEKPPKLRPDESHWVYQYAPYQASYTLSGVEPGSVVYAVEGLDWKRVRKVEQPRAPQTGAFEPGEMKLYLAAPRAPKGLDVSASVKGGTLLVSSTLKGLKMPWPLTVTVSDPQGTELYRLHRATNSSGKFTQTLPLGTNIRPGDYTVRLESPIGGLAASRQVQVGSMPAIPAPVAEKVRVFDEGAIRALFSRKPALTIALGSDAFRPSAERLANELRARGVRAEIRPEGEVWRKARYPRVWDPYSILYTPGGEPKEPAGQVELQVTLESAADGRTVARTPEGKDLGDEWLQPGTMATVTGNGFSYQTAIGGWFYEPGVKLYVEKDRRLQVVQGTETRATSDMQFRQRWGRPWARLSSYEGVYYLCPQLPEAYAADTPLILLGDSKGSELVAALQASELLPQVVDDAYPGPGKALISYAWSPFALEKDVILVGAADPAGLEAGIGRLLGLARER